jgi:pimeloyl-ACP methyl ester carboxylesterase
MVTREGDGFMQVLCLAEESQLIALLRERVGALATDGAGARHVLAQGARANAALRACLGAPGGIDAVVLVSPPSVDALDADVVGRLREVDAPVLALFGTEDLVSPPGFGAGWRRALGKCTVIFVFGAGADMGNERPEAVATLVADFLARRENFLVRTEDDRLHA